MELKITTLIENQPDDKGELAFEHGLSLFIEFAGKRLLFDTGQTGAFADNARKLGIDLSRLDAVILSHGHYDHSGGLARLLPLLAPGTPLYVGEGFFRPKYKRINLNVSKDCTIPGDLKNPGGSFQYNGNPFPREILAPYQVALRQLGTDTTWLTPKIVIFKGFEKSCPFEQPNPRFYTEYGSGLQPDTFDDEIALGLLTGKGLVFLSGCAHPGILNMLQTGQHSAICLETYSVGLPAGDGYHICPGLRRTIHHQRLQPIRVIFPTQPRGEHCPISPQAEEATGAHGHRCYFCPPLHMIMGEIISDFSSYQHSAVRFCCCNVIPDPICRAEGHHARYPSSLPAPLLHVACVHLLKPFQLPQALLPAAVRVLIA